MARIMLHALGVCLALCAASAAYADGAGAISFSQPIYSVAQDAAVALIVLNRTGGSSGVASATYMTANSAALAGVDYSSTQGTVSWADGDAAPKAFMVPISAQATVGADFTVNLLSASVAAFGTPISTSIFIGAPASMAAASAAGAIEFSQLVYSVAPGANSVMATLNRVQGSSGSALATYATENGSTQAGAAFAPASGAVTWADGDFSPKNIWIPLNPSVDAGQTFYLALLSASGAAFGDPLEASISIRQSAAGSVTLSWGAPTQNTDGSTLTDLAGYYIYYGTAGAVTNVLPVLGASATSVVLSNLSPGVWYFAAMAYNASGVTSGLSGLASTTIE